MQGTWKPAHTGTATAAADHRNTETVPATPSDCWIRLGAVSLRRGPCWPQRGSNDRRLPYWSSHREACGIVEQIPARPDGGPDTASRPPARARRAARYLKTHWSSTALNLVVQLVGGLAARGRATGESRMALGGIMSSVDGHRARSRFLTSTSVSLPNAWLGRPALFLGARAATL